MLENLMPTYGYSNGKHYWCWVAEFQISEMFLYVQEVHMYLYLYLYSYLYLCSMMMKITYIYRILSHNII